MNPRYTQFVGRKEHDGEGALFRVLAALLEVVTQRAVSSRRADGTRGEELFRKHVLVADNSGPWWIALQPGPVVVAGLAVKLQRGHGLLLVELLALVLRHAAGRLPLLILAVCGGCGIGGGLGWALSNLSRLLSVRRGGLGGGRLASSLLVLLRDGRLAFGLGGLGGLGLGSRLIKVSMGKLSYA